MRTGILAIVGFAILLCLLSATGAHAEWVIKCTLEGAMWAAPPVTNSVLPGGRPAYVQPDMNGDGHPDALVFHNPGSAGNGSLGYVGIADIGAAQTTWFQDAGNAVGDPRIPPFYFDADGDGWPDVAVQVWGSGGAETLIIGWSSVGAAVANPTTPATTTLAQNRPNPSAGGTTIAFTLAAKSQVRLAIYDVSGRLVNQLVEGALAGGSYSIPWDGRDSAGNPVAAGSYFYQLAVAGRDESKRMVVIR